MSVVELRTSRVSLYGHVADEQTRQDVAPGDFRAWIDAPPQEALRKDDGHFVFADLPALATSVTVLLEGPAYRRRSLPAALLPDTAVALEPAGEDELFLCLTGVSAGDQQVSFDTIPFLPSIDAGAAVLGPGGFAQTLAEPLEGGDVAFAVLSSVAGLNPGDLLRVVRSARILLRAGPYHPFTPDTTLVAFTIVEDDAEATPIADAAVSITQVNDAPLQTVTIDGVALQRVPLAPSGFLVLGTAADITRTSNERGLAVFAYQAQAPVQKIAVTITRNGYIAESRAVTVTASQRTSTSVTLLRA